MPSPDSRLLRALPFLAAAAFLWVIAALLWVLPHPIALDDGLRHVAMASRMSREGIFAVPGWSTFLFHGVLSETTVDPWFLSDVLLVPLTPLGAFAALDVFTFLSVAFVVAAFLIALRTLRTPPLHRTFFLILLLAGDLGFSGRLPIGRPFALMTGMTMLTIAAIAARRWTLVGLLLAVSALLSQLFVFPLAIAGGAACLLWVQRSPDRGRALGATVAGTALGLLLHPSPLLYIGYLVTVFLRIPFLGRLGLGGEMASALRFDITSVLLAVAWIALLLAAHWKRSPGWKSLRSQPAQIVLLGACAALFFAYLFWMRTIDLLWPLLLVAIAALEHAAPGIAHRTASVFFPTPRWRTGALCAILAVCALQWGKITVDAVNGNRGNDLAQFPTLQALPAGSRVLTPDWGIFPVLITLRPDLRYSAGIDTSFTYLADPEGWAMLDRLRNDEGTPQDRSALADRILAHFRPEAVLLTRRTAGKFFDEAKKFPGWQLVEETNGFSLFRLDGTGGGSPR